jgi:hypothetical protein
MGEEFGDIMRVLLATAPHDKPAAASLTDGTARYRRALAAVARRPADLHALRDGMGVEQAVDGLWFISAILASSLCAKRTAGATNAERWLGAQANWALLRKHPLCWRHICATTIDLENPRPWRSARNSTGEKKMAVGPTTL